MKIRFAKDYRHNYLIVEMDGRNENKTYAVKMITENPIKGLLRCQKRNINGEMLLYYEITSRQSMKALFERQPFKMCHLQSFFRELKVVNEELAGYLLSVENLFLQPDYIYCDLQANAYFFLFYPGEESMPEESFQEFVSFVMAHMDAEDMQMVEAVYQMADLFQKQQLVLDEILVWFEENFGETTDRENKINQNKRFDVQEENQMISSRTEYENQAGILSSKRKPLRWNQRIREWFQHKFFAQNTDKKTPDEHERSYRKTPEIFEEEVPVLEDDRTMYIPWVENSDNKLYGIGKGNKYHISLSHLPLTVGKMAGAVDMVIHEPSVSRLHAKFSREGNRFYITDLNSTNGTFRNGIRLEPNDTQLIEPGDEIGLGKLKFIYR